MIASARESRPSVVPRWITRCAACETTVLRRAPTLTRLLTRLDAGEAQEGPNSPRGATEATHGTSTTREGARNGWERMARDLPMVMAMWSRRPKAWATEHRHQCCALAERAVQRSSYDKCGTDAPVTVTATRGRSVAACRTGHCRVVRQ
jgi:hypothetical protein